MNHATVFGFPQPDARSGRASVAPVYPPASKGYNTVHHKYVEACNASRKQVAKYHAFCQIWLQCVPHIQGLACETTHLTLFKCCISLNMHSRLDHYISRYSLFGIYNDANKQQWKYLLRESSGRFREVKRWDLPVNLHVLAHLRMRNGVAHAQKSNCYWG